MHRFWAWINRLKSGGSVVSKMYLLNVSKSFGQFMRNQIETEQILRIDALEVDVQSVRLSHMKIEELEIAIPVAQLYQRIVLLISMDDLTVAQ